MATYNSFDDIPREQHKVILADPNWQFKTYSKKGEGKSASRHYNCDPTELIMEHPVKELIHPEGSVLFLWCTWPKIFHAERVINAWGFNYSGLAWEWIKKNPATEKYAFGGGYITRKNLEPCLVATSKKFKTGKERKNRSTRDFLYAPRREHSQKPIEQYERIENLFGGPYLELFARYSRPGWDSMGDEIDQYTKEDFKQAQASTWTGALSAALTG